MTALYILSIGAFMQAAAHYIKNGPDSWYVVYLILGAVFSIISDRTRS